MALHAVYPRRTHGIASRLVDGEAVVVDPKKNLVYILNATASSAWHLADGTRCNSTIIQLIASRCEVEESQVAIDLADLWESLTERALLDLQDHQSKSPAGNIPMSEENLPVIPYSMPRIESEEALNVLAAVCSSARTSDPVLSCQSFGSCQIPFQ